MVPSLADELLAVERLLLLVLLETKLAWFVGAFIASGVVHLRMSGQGLIQILRKIVRIVD